MRIALLSGAFPPQFDGIGDHTGHLSQALADQGHEVFVFTSFAQGRPKPPNVEVICCFDPGRPQSILALSQQVRSRECDWLIVQYNPFSFGPRGFTPWLIEALLRTRTPVAIMFHETYVPLWPWRYTLMRLWQYPQFVILVRFGRRYFASAERWIPQVQSLTKERCSLLPVGSNLPLCKLTKAEAKAELGLPREALVLGMFGFAHVSKRTAWVGTAARRIHRRFPQAQLLSVGQTSDSLTAACGNVRVRQEGFLLAQEASLRLRAMDLFLAPLADGISARRTSVITAFQHGVPVCSTFREYTDQFLREFNSPSLSLTPSDNEALFIDSTLDMAEKCLHQSDLGQDLVAFHDEHFAWQVIAQRLLLTLTRDNTKMDPFSGAI